MYVASWLGEFFRIRKIPPMNIAILTISLGKKFLNTANKQEK